MRFWPFGRTYRLLARKSTLEVLEDRIVLDAAVDAAPQDQQNTTGTASSGAATGTPADQADVPDGGAGATDGQGTDQTITEAVQDVLHQNLNVVLISNHLDGIEEISSAVGADSKVIVYDASESDLSAVIGSLQEEVLAAGRQIDHLAWFTHGDPGVLKVVDNLMFSAGTVASDPQSWQLLGSLMAQDSRIDLYGCDIGQGVDGTHLVGTLAEVTGAVVWASDDTTGSGDAADWDLEVKSGENNLPWLVDTYALEAADIILDNGGLINPGFETGNITGWNVTNLYTVVSSSTGGNYGGFNAGASPYVADSAYMLRLAGDTTLTVPSDIWQQFNYLDDDHLAFAYNFVTSDGGPDYYDYDIFRYQVTVNGNQVVNYQIESGDVPPNTLGTFRATGWQQVDIDLSLYAQAGDTIVFRVWAGNTVDNQYDSWAFIDLIQSYNLPTADPASVTAPMNESVTFQVIGYDPDLHPVTQVSFDVVANYGVTHGTILAVDAFGAATSPQYDATNHYYYQVFTYTPVPDYWGEDSFLFTFSTPGGTWNGFGTTAGQAIGTDTYNTYAVALTDINRDGNMDLVAANSNGNTNPNQPNLFYMSDLSGFFVNGVSMDAYSGNPTGDSIGLAVGDLNDDGYMDVVVRNGRTQLDVVYLWNDAAQAFSPVSTLGGSNDGNNGAIGLGDFNRDGNLDVVVGSGDSGDGEVIYWGNGDGSFNSSTTLPAVAGTTSVLKAADFNGDGYVDIFVGKSSNNNSAILYNDGSDTDGNGFFTFAHTVAIAGVTYVSSADVGDVDSDGDLDLVVGRNGGGNNSRNYFVQNTGITGGHVNWSASNITTDQFSTRGIALADVDRDGDLDVLVADYGSTVKLYSFEGGTNFTATNISSGNLNARSISVGDVDGDGDIDCVVGINNGQNRYFENGGFRGGSSVWHHADPALVSIHVEPIYNWSFEKVGDHYDGWTLTETYADDTLPAIILDEFSTFAIIPNQPGGTVIHWGDVLYDYYDNNMQVQLSPQMFTEADFPGSGLPGITIDGSKTDNTAVLLSGGLREAVLTQTVSFAQDIYLEKLEFSWDLSYWNTNPAEDPGSEFNADQFLAVYLYDSSGAKISAWTSADEAVPATVDSMQHYAVKMSASDALVTAIKSGPVEIVIEFQVHGMEWYLDAAIDDFTLVPTRHYPAFQENPVAMASATVSPTSGVTPADAGILSIVESEPAIAFTMATATFGSRSPFSLLSLAVQELSGLDEVTGASTPADATPPSTMSFSDSGLGIWDVTLQNGSGVPSGFSSLSVLSDLVQSDTNSRNSSGWTMSFETTDSTLQLLSESSASDPRPGAEDLLGTLDEGGFGETGTDSNQVILGASQTADPFFAASAPETALNSDPVVVSGGTDGTSESGIGAGEASADAASGTGTMFDPLNGVVFNLKEIDLFQAMLVERPLMGETGPLSTPAQVAAQLMTGDSFAVRVDSLSFLDLLA